MPGFMDKFEALRVREQEAAKRRDYTSVAKIKDGMRDLFARTPSTYGAVKVGEWSGLQRIVTDNGQEYALVNLTPYPVKKEGEYYVLLNIPRFG